MVMMSFRGNEKEQKNENTSFKKCSAHFIVLNALDNIDLFGTNNLHHKIMLSKN
jgi:hypothetical protein